MNKTLKNLFVTLTAAAALCTAFFTGCNAATNEDILYGTIGSSLEKTPPGEVTNIKGSVGSTKLIISWDLPADKDLYGVKIVPATGTVDKNGEIIHDSTLYNTDRSKIPTEQVYNGLASNTPYNFTIYTFDRNWNISGGSACQFSTDKTNTDKFRPDFVAASAGDGFVKLSWKLQESVDSDDNPLTPDDTMIIHGLRLRIVSDKKDEVFQNINIIENPLPTTYTVNGLTNETYYQFYLTQFDDELSYSMEASIQGKPTIDINKMEVTDLTASSGDTNVTLSWKNPVSDTSDFIGVVITADPAEGTLTKPIYYINTVNDKLVPTSLLVEGLTNNTNYNFKIATLNRKYYESNGKTINGNPLVNANSLEVTMAEPIISDGAVTLKWTIPQNTASTKIIGIKIEASSTDGNLGTLSEPVFFVDTEDRSKLPTSLDVTGLDNGKTYTFTIHTLSSQNYLSTVGRQKVATPVKNANTVTVTNFKATAADGYVMLTWNKPVSTAKTKIIGLKIEAESEGALGTLEKPLFFMDDEAALPTSLKVENLENDKSYIFKIYTLSSEYYLSDSYATATAMPVMNTNTLQVSNMNAVSGDKSVQLSWTNPADTASTKTIGLLITATPAEGSLSQPVYYMADKVADLPSSLAVTGLTNGTSYEFQITTLSSQYYLSSKVTSKSVAPQKNQNKTEVTGLNAAAGDKYVQLSWTNPADSTGIIGLMITATPAEGTLSEPIYYMGEKSSDLPSSLKVESLSNGTSYQFTVKTVSSLYYLSENGQSASSIPAKGLNKNKVTGLVAAIADKTVHLSWTNPVASDFYGVMISAETTSKTASLGTLTQPVYYMNSDSSKIPNSFTVTGLSNNETYTFYVYTINPQYYLSESPSSTSATPTPTSNSVEVTGIKAMGANNSATVTWKNPSAADLADIDYYLITVLPADVTPIRVNDLTATSCPIQNLTNGTYYSFTLQTVDTNGNISNGVSANATPDSGSSGIYNCEDLIDYKRTHRAYDFGFCSAATEKTFSLISSSDMNLALTKINAVMGQGSYTVVSCVNTTEGKEGTTTVIGTDTFDLTVRYNPAVSSNPSWDEADLLIGGISTNAIRLIGSNFAQPKNIGGKGDPHELRLWLRADMITDKDLTDSGKVKTMPDYSGNGFVAAASDTTNYNVAPTFKETDSDFNNLPVVDFSQLNTTQTGQATQQAQLIATGSSGTPIVTGAHGNTTFVVFKLGNGDEQYRADQTIIATNYGLSFPTLKNSARYFNNKGWYIANDFKYGLSVRASGMAGTWRWACINNDGTDDNNRMLVTQASTSATGQKDNIGFNTLSACMVFDRDKSNSKVGSDYPSNIRFTLNGDERLLGYLDSLTTASAYSESALKEKNGTETPLLQKLAATSTSSPNTYGCYGRPFGDGKGHRHGSLTDDMNVAMTSTALHNTWKTAAANTSGRPNGFDRSMYYNSPAALNNSGSAYASADYFVNWAHTDQWRNGTINTITLGADLNNSTYSYSRVAEVFIFEGALTDAEILQMNNYIKYRYNIQTISTNTADYDVD